MSEEIKRMIISGEIKLEKSSRTVPSPDGMTEQKEEALILVVRGEKQDHEHGAVINPVVFSRFDV